MLTSTAGMSLMVISCRRGACCVRGPPNRPVHRSTENVYSYTVTVPVPFGRGTGPSGPGGTGVGRGSDGTEPNESTDDVVVCVTVAGGTRTSL